ncbi:MAG TPA: hypothetical protein VN316_00900 [candidate division Zixibacteria bacterium]|nr:hypothetical protein [candidate division Zixibacteria bacterium]
MQPENNADTVSQNDHSEEAIISGKFIRHLSSSEYAALISMVIASLYLLLTSFFPIVYNLTSSFDPVDFLTNIFYFIIGLGTLSGVSFLIRKETHLQHIADETFERVIYSRLEPVLRDVAQVQVGLTAVQTRLDMMNRNIETVSKKEVTEAPAASSPSHVKYIILINLTLAVFLFMLQYPLTYVPYAITVIYIIWWGVITAEHKLWDLDVTWMWIFVPVLVLPVYTIAMNSYLQDYQLFGSLFFGLGLYIFLYYSWCSFMLKGVIPFGIDDAVRSVQNKIDTVQTDKILQKPELTLNLKIPSRAQVGRNMILLAVMLLCVTWFGYAIQHNIIPNISWEMMGLVDFVWPASYTYILNMLGLLLIISGLRFLKRIET